MVTHLKQNAVILKTKEDDFPNLEVTAVVKEHTTHAPASALPTATGCIHALAVPTATGSIHALALPAATGSIHALAVPAAT
jgi:hypothetical protein